MSDRSERTVEFLPGYDYRNDPENSGRGCHGMDVMFILRVGQDAISWRLMTGWLPTADARHPLQGTPSLIQYDPNAGPVVIHSASKRQDWWSDGGICEYITADKCWGDIGYLVGDKVLSALASDGHEGVWAELRRIYDAWTEKGDAA